MCGIAGYVGKRQAVPIILDSLMRLEYRGYDSAGIATLPNGHIDRRRAKGKLDCLRHMLKEHPLNGTTGIGHTRWATHGPATDGNAHPHGTARVNVVHNGIIENHDELRAELVACGHEFETPVDTEVIARLIDQHLLQGMDPWAASNTAFDRLQGAYSVAAIFSGHHGMIVGAQNGAPMAIGRGDDEMFVGSDALALIPHTQHIAYMRDGDRVCVNHDGAKFYDESGATVVREFKLAGLNPAAISKGGYPHFMLKEIHEHPAVVSDILSRFVNDGNESVSFPDLGIDLASVERVVVSACGTAFYAARLGALLMEQLAGVEIDAEVASEYRYREPRLRHPEHTLGIVVSQSGETADTLAALKYMQAQGVHTLSVLNVAESRMGRQSDAVLPTLAGPEISVASTKAFSGQVTTLALLAIAMARANGSIDSAREAQLLSEMGKLPGLMAHVLRNLDKDIHRVAEAVAPSRSAMYLGRGICKPLAMEGALKLKEISYIHAEGYAAGEMKHGPISLIDKDMPVIALAPTDSLFAKTASNIEEAAARGGRVIVFSDSTGAKKLKSVAYTTVVLPTVDPFTAPILYCVLLHLLAYRVAVLKGTDVDQPRNLAKSVTVE
jgi:glucosamine--fructose-6-phosphate aminotransferase (isomerizing)